MGISEPETAAGFGLQTDLVRFSLMVRAVSGLAGAALCPAGTAVPYQGVMASALPTQPEWMWQPRWLEQERQV